MPKASGSKGDSVIKKVKKSLSGEKEKKFAQVTEKKPGILKAAKKEIAEVEKSECFRRYSFYSSGYLSELFTELASDRPGQGYGIWAIKEGDNIKAVSEYFRSGSPLLGSNLDPLSIQRSASIQLRLGGGYHFRVLDTRQRQIQ